MPRAKPWQQPGELVVRFGTNSHDKKEALIEYINR